MKTVGIFLLLLLSLDTAAQSKWFLSAQAGITKQFTILRGDTYAIKNPSTESEKFELTFQLQTKDKWHYQMGVSRLTYWSPSSFFELPLFWDLGKSYQMSLLIGKPLFEAEKSSLSVFTGLNIASLLGDFHGQSKGGGSQISDQYELYYTRKEKNKNLLNILLRLNVQYTVKISQSLYFTLNSSGILGLNKMTDNYFEYRIIEKGSEKTYHSIIANYGTHFDLMIGLKYHLNNKNDIFKMPE